MTPSDRTADVIRLLIGLAVAALVGETVVAEQRAALDGCAPGCDLRGLVVANVDVVVSTPFELATRTIGPVPVGGLALMVVCWWAVRIVSWEPRF